MKQNIEVKNIQIDASLQKNLKLYCVENGLVMKTLIEKLIKDELKRVHNYGKEKSV